MMQANDQAEPQADRDRSSNMKAGEVGKRSPRPFWVRSEAPTQSPTQSIAGTRKPDNLK